MTSCITAKHLTESLAHMVNDHALVKAISSAKTNFIEEEMRVLICYSYVSKSSYLWRKLSIA